MTIMNMFLGLDLGNIGTPPVFIANTESTGLSVSSFSQPVPSGNAGDLLLLIVTSTERAANTPAGWTLLFENINAQAFIHFYYKTAAAASEANITVTLAATTNTHSVIFRFRNANPIPVINSGGAFNYVPTATINYPAVASPALTDYNIQFAYFFNPNVTVATPTNSTVLYINNDGAPPSFFTFFDIGPSVNKSSTYSQSSTNPAYSAQIRIRRA